MLCNAASYVFSWLLFYKLLSIHSIFSIYFLLYNLNFPSCIKLSVLGGVIRIYNTTAFISDILLNLLYNLIGYIKSINIKSIRSIKSLL